MGDTTWDTSKPAATDAPADSDDDLRDSFLGIKERLDVDHEMGFSSGTTVKTESQGAGHHKVVNLDVQGSDPTVAADHGAIYTKDVSSKAELHWKDEDGNVKQITSGGNLNVVKADLDSGVADDSTIELDATNGLQLKDDGIEITDNTGSYDIAKFGTKGAVDSTHGPPGAMYASDWAACSAGDTKTVTHNLGTQDLLITVLVASDANGTDARAVNGFAFISSGNKRGCEVQSVTTTQLTVQFAAQSIGFNLDSGGSPGSAMSSGFFKVIALRMN